MEAFVSVYYSKASGTMFLLQARYDAFRRRYIIAHMKKSVIDNELFPFRTEVGFLYQTVNVSSCCTRQSLAKSNFANTEALEDVVSLI